MSKLLAAWTDENVCIFHNLCQLILRDLNRCQDLQGLTFREVFTQKPIKDLACVAEERSLAVAVAAGSEWAAK